jgi:hypothetical protein
MAKNAMCGTGGRYFSRDHRLTRDVERQIVSLAGQGRSLREIAVSIGACHEAVRACLRSGRREAV